MANNFQFPIRPDDIFLFYDTETSGLPVWGKPSEDDCQPKILQLCAILTDAANKKLASLDVVLRWRGVSIDPDTAEVNGFTPEIIDKYGVSPDAVMDLFFAMHDRASVRVAHNESFDARMVRVFMKQSGRFSENDMEAFKGAMSFDTAQALRPVMQLPPTEKMKATARFANSFKTPNLGEAYLFCTGETLVGAHGAMKDASACRTIFFHLSRLLAEGPAAPAAASPVSESTPAAPEGRETQESAPAASGEATKPVSTSLYDW